MKTLASSDKKIIEIILMLVFKSNKSMDLDFNNPDCSYSKMIPAKSNTKWTKINKVSKQIPTSSPFLYTKVKG